MTARSRIGLGLTVLAVCAALAPVVSGLRGGIVLPGGPSAAVPRVADVGGSAGGPGGPRDGSAAVPFVAQVGPDQGSGGEGFDWGDAALGALAGGLLVLLAHRVGPGSPSRAGSTEGDKWGTSGGAEAVGLRPSLPSRARSDSWSLPRLCWRRQLWGARSIASLANTSRSRPSRGRTWISPAPRSAAPSTYSAAGRGERSTGGAWSRTRARPPLAALR